MKVSSVALFCIYCSVFIPHALGYHRRDFSSELITPDKYHYVPLAEIGVDISRYQTSFQFTVCAKNDVHLALHKYDGVTDKDMYEIVIGGWANRQSVIRTSRQGKNLVHAKHKPLNSRAFIHFWISWKNGVVSVGKGSKVGRRRFMAWKNPHPHAVNYISVSTGWGATGDWRFKPSLLSPIATIATKNHYSYRLVGALDSQLKHESSLSFYVKASNDAHIALQTYKGNTVKNMYEIVLGGWHNSQSVIREKKQGATLAYAKHHPLSANNYLPFWISFHNGRISVGEGMVVGSRRFMSWTDSTPTKIRYVGVSTGWGATGSWLFYTCRKSGRYCSKQSLCYNVVDDF